MASSRCCRFFALSVAVLVLVVGLVSPAWALDVEEIDKLLASGSAGDLAGAAVAVSGDYAIVGATGAGTGGAAYIFKRNVSDEWELKQSLAVTGGLDADDNYGVSVAISGAFAVVGAPGDDDDGSGAGAAYVFSRSGETWSQAAKLVAGGTLGAAGDAFGTSVAIEGGTVIAGADSDDDNGNNSGSAYAFVQEPDASWVLADKFSPADGAASDRFGAAVALSGGTALVGAPVDGGTGSAYAFVRECGEWVEQAKLTVGGLALLSLFGDAVAVDGDVAVVGACCGNDGDGNAYLFTRDAQSAWSLQQELLPAPEDVPDLSRFGRSVSVSGRIAVVGTESAGAHVFLQIGDDWSQESRLVASDGGGLFGFAVSVSGQNIVVGASGDDEEGTDAGAAYGFDLDGINFPPLIATVGTQEVDEGDLLEFTVSASDSDAGDTVVLAAEAVEGELFPDGLSLDPSTGEISWVPAFDSFGEYHVRIVATDDGSPAASSSEDVRIVVDTATVPSELLKLEAADAASSDYFGRDAVALSGDTAVIGAYADDDNGADSGSAYVFVRSGSTWAQQQKLTPDDGALGDLFGHSVAVDGDTVVVGAHFDDDNGFNSGSAYVFVRSGSTWTQQAKLTPADGGANDVFGFSVALSGDTALIGAYGDDDDGSNAGAIYIFVRTGSTWSQQTKLTASDAAADDYFGYSLDLSGNTAVVGAYRDDDNGTDSGSAYVFVRSGTTWSQQAKLTASDGTASDSFSRNAVAVAGDTAIIGAYADDDDGSTSGSAYVFVRTGTSWAQQQKLTASDGAAGDSFGFSVVLSGDTAIIGAYGDDDNGATSGSAYLFERAGLTWSQIVKLTASDGAAGDRFGLGMALTADTGLIGAYGDSSFAGSVYVLSVDAAAQKLLPHDVDGGDDAGLAVAVSNDHAVVGAPAQTGGGAAYIFERIRDSWEQQAELSGSDTQAGDEFSDADAVGISGGSVVVGAPSAGTDGAAYVFVDDSGSWSEEDKLTASDGATDDAFGDSAAIDGDIVVVGAPGDDDNGSASGSAYVFVRSAGSWSEEDKLTASDGAADDLFGEVVALSGDTAVVGAPGDDDDGSASGAAYVFVRGANGTWSQQTKLTASDGAADDEFGRSVAIEGDTIVVGAPGDDNGGSASGSAYVFVRSGTSWTEQQRLFAGDAAASDDFGRSVAVSADRIAVGAPGDDDPGESGSVYVFQRAADCWQERTKLRARDAGSSDDFGFSVGLAPNAVVAGAPDDDDLGTDAGAAWAFIDRDTVATVALVAPAADQTVVPAGDLLVAAYDISLRNGTNTLESITFSADVTLSNDGDESTDVEVVRLVHDADGDNAIGAGDLVLDSGAYTADDGRITLTVGSGVAFAGDGSPERFLVLYRFAGTVESGEEFAIRLELLDWQSAEPRVHAVNVVSPTTTIGGLLVIPDAALTGTSVPIAIVGAGFDDGSVGSSPGSGTWSTVSFGGGVTTLTANGTPGWADDLFNGEEFFPNAEDDTLETVLDTLNGNQITVSGDITSLVSAGDTFRFGTNLFITDGTNDLIVHSVVVASPSLLLADVELKSLDGSPVNADPGLWDVTVDSPDPASTGRIRVTATDGFEVLEDSAGAPVLSFTSPTANESVTDEVDITLSYPADVLTDTLFVSADVALDDGLQLLPPGANLADLLDFDFGATSASRSVPTGWFVAADGTAWSGPVVLRAFIRDGAGLVSDVAERQFYIGGTGTGSITGVSPDRAAREASGVAVTVSLSVSVGAGATVQDPNNVPGLTLSTTGTGAMSVDFTVTSTSATPIGRHVFEVVDGSSTYEFTFWITYPESGGQATFGPSADYTRDDATAQPQEPPRNPTIGGVGVNLANGEYILPVTDMVIPVGRGFPFAFTRTYRSTVDYHGPLGHNWDFNYNRRVEFVDGTPDLVRCYNGGGRIDDFEWEDRKGTDFDAFYADGFYKRFDVFSDLAAGTTRTDGQAQAGDVIVCRDRHGSRMIFTPLVSGLFNSGTLGARLDRIADRHGNECRCVYNAIGQLVTVIDPHGRGVEFVWGDDGYLEAIRDFTSAADWYRTGADRREVLFTVDSSGDLVEVASPETDRYDGSERISVAYDYDEVARLSGLSGDHYLTTCTDGKGQDYLICSYTDVDGGAGVDARVTTQQLGTTGQDFHLNYDSAGDSGTSTGIAGAVLTDTGASWNTNQFAGLEVTIDDGNTIGTYRVVSNTTTALTVDATIAESHPADYTLPMQTNVIDRKGFKTLYTINSDGTLAEHARMTGTWNDAGDDRTGAALRSTDPTFYLTTFTYNADFERTATTLPRGNSIENTFDTTTSDPLSEGNLLETLRLANGITGDQTQIRQTFTYESRFNLIKTTINPRAYDTSDPIWNGSPPSESVREAAFTTTYIYDHDDLAGLDADVASGNLIRVESPDVGLVDGGSHQIITHHAYNAFGQRVASTDGEGTTTLFRYFEHGKLRHYLRETVAGYGDRNLVSSYQYNAVGSTVAMTDPRGHTWTYTVNELGQTVSTTHPTLSSYGGGTYYGVTFFDENHNVEFTAWSDVNAFGSGPGAPSDFTSTSSYTPAGGWITTSTSYNILNYPTSRTEDITASDTRETQFQYDANYNRTATLSPEAVNSNQPKNRTDIVFDERNLVYQSMRADGDTTNDPDTGLDNETLVESDYDDNGNPVERRVHREATYVVSMTAWRGESGGAQSGTDDGILTFTTTYDGFDRAVTSTDDAGHYSTTRYNAASQARVSFASDSGDNVLTASISEFDEIGRTLTSQRLALTSAHPSFSDPESFTLTAAEAFDDDSDGWAETEFLYNRRSQTTETTDDLGRTTESVYDATGWLTETKLPQVTGETARNRTLYVYDANRNLVRQTDDLVDSEDSSVFEFTMEYEFDEHNRRITTIDNTGSTWRQRYSSLGIVTRSTDAENEVVEVEHDLLGRVTKTIYVGAGNGSGSGGADLWTGITVYDENDRVTSVTDGEGFAATYAYNPRDELITITQADSTTEDLRYDDAGNLIRREDRAGNVFDHTYDEERNLLRVTEITLATGFEGVNLENYDYDGLGRMTMASNWEDDGASGFDHIHGSLISYTTFSQQDACTEGLSIERLGGDDTTIDDRTYAAAYNGVGQRMTNFFDQAVSGQHQQFTRDELDRVTGMLDPVFSVGGQGAGGSTWTHEWLGTGLIRKIRWPDLPADDHQMETVVDYNDDLLPETWVNRTTADNTLVAQEYDVAGVEYGYNEINQVVGESHLHRVGYGKRHVYSADATHRHIETAMGVLDAHDEGTVGGDTLAERIDNSHKRQQFVLDDGNQRESWSETSGDAATTFREHTIDYTTSPSGTEGDERMDQILATDDEGGSIVPGEDWTYDDNGNLLSDTTSNDLGGDGNYVWDAYNRIIAIETPDGTFTLQQFIYDALSRKVATGFGDSFDATMVDSSTNVTGWACYYECGGSRVLARRNLRWDGVSAVEDFGLELADCYIHGLGGSTMHVGSLISLMTPLTDAAGTPHALASFSGVQVRERYSYNSDPAIEPAWVGVWDSTAGATYSAGTNSTTITQTPALTLSSTSTNWDNFLLRIDQEGSIKEFRILESITSMGNLVGFRVDGDATGEALANNQIFEIVGALGFTVPQNGVTAITDGSDTLTRIEPAAGETFPSLESTTGARHQYLKINLEDGETFRLARIETFDPTFGTNGAFYIRGDWDSIIDDDNGDFSIALIDESTSSYNAFMDNWIGGKVDDGTDQYQMPTMGFAGTTLFNRRHGLAASEAGVGLLGNTRIAFSVSPSTFMSAGILCCVGGSWMDPGMGADPEMPSPDAVFRPAPPGPPARCGPDVTDWFSLELSNINVWSRFATSWRVAHGSPNLRGGRQSPWNSNPLEMIRSGGVHGFNYKMDPGYFTSEGCPSSVACRNTVTLCGQCINVSELGNISWALFASTQLGRTFYYNPRPLVVAADEVTRSFIMFGAMQVPGGTDQPEDAAGVFAGLYLLEQLGNPTGRIMPQSLCEALNSPPSERLVRALMSDTQEWIDFASTAAGVGFGPGAGNANVNHLLPLLQGGAQSPLQVMSSGRTERCPPCGTRFNKPFSRLPRFIDVLADEESWGGMIGN